ncbi:MAG TPA: D-glycero-beta-D-manno-heptose 1,7-bisphosphate 7-phosphatase [Cellvibrionaceae bacterium]
MKLVILDRDGVINQDNGDFIRTVDAWIPIPGSIEAIAELHGAGFTVVIATNQSGLARGHFDLDDLEAMHAKLTELVEAAGAELGGIFYCPHGPDDGCKCRKPLPGLIDAIEAEFNTAAVGAPLIGDTLRDLQAGAAKGCKLMLVKTGNGEQTLTQLDTSEQGYFLEDMAVQVSDNLAAAARTIIAEVDTL